jgi:hypothetical protein
MSYLYAAIMVLSLSACVTRGEVDATIWMHNGLPEEMCVQASENQAQGIGWDYGFYRKLKDGKLEFISFCDPTSKQWLAMHKDDYEKWMSLLVKKK